MVYFLDAIASLDLGFLSVSQWQMFLRFSMSPPNPTCPLCFVFRNTPCFFHVSSLNQYVPSTPCVPWFHVSSLSHVSLYFMCPLYTICPQVPCVPFIPSTSCDPSVPCGSSVLVSLKYLWNKIRGKWRIKIGFCWFPQLNCTISTWLILHSMKIQIFWTF